MGQGGREGDWDFFFDGHGVAGFGFADFKIHSIEGEGAGDLCGVALKDVELESRIGFLDAVHCAFEFSCEGIFLCAGLDAGYFQCGNGVFFDVKEVGGAEMGIALFVFGIDTGDIDADFYDGVLGIVGIKVGLREGPFVKDAFGFGDDVFADERN